VVHPLALLRIEVFMPYARRFLLHGRHARRVARWLLAVALLALALLPARAVAAPGETTRLSVSSLGVEADGASSPGFISGDGRWVAFSSFASNLVVADTDRFSDVYLRDRQTGELRVESRSSTGVKGNGTSSADAITRDGRFVLFRSEASNLVPGDTNARNPQGFPMGDLFLRDLQTGTTERVNVSSSGAQTNNYTDNGAVSDDGRFVAFRSDATNLVANDRNGRADIFLRDRVNRTTTRVSLNFEGRELNAPSFNPEISPDGRFVAYSTDATNALRNDQNGSAAEDVFVYDRTTARTELVSVSSAEVQGNNASVDAELSGDGRFVAFHSAASNLVAGDTALTNDMFVRDRQAGTTERISVSSTGTTDSENMSGTYHAITRDGRFVAFATQKRLVPDDTGVVTDVYVRDRLRGSTTRASVSTAGTQANGPSYWPSLSDDGLLVVFGSDATNLIANDTSDRPDVYLRELTDPDGPPPPPPPPPLPPPPPTGLVLDPATVSGGTDSRGTVTIAEPAPAGGAIYGLSSSDTAVAATPASVTVPQGSTTATFSVATARRSTPADAVITATGGEVSAQATITVDSPPEPTALTLDPATVDGGQASIATLTVARPPSPGGATYHNSSNSTWAAVQPTVFVPAGSTQGTFRVSTGFPSSSQTAVITSEVFGISRQATLTIRVSTPADTVTVTRAEYTSSNRELRVEATSTSASATLRAFVDSTGALIGTLQNAGGGQYRGQFTNVPNPSVVRVTSSLGGSATRTVTAR
jgi:Tol biopolymer transport system component